VADGVTDTAKRKQRKEGGMTCVICNGNVADGVLMKSNMEFVCWDCICEIEQGLYTSVEDEDFNKRTPEDNT
jgi:hypothetical protein